MNARECLGVNVPSLLAAYLVLFPLFSLYFTHTSQPPKCWALSSFSEKKINRWRVTKLKLDTVKLEVSSLSFAQTETLVMVSQCRQRVPSMKQ